MRHRLYSVALSLALALFALTGCQSTDNGALALAPSDGPVVFRVGTTAVTVEDFRQRMERDIGAGVASLASDGQTREQIEEQANQQNVRQVILDTMIQELLLAQAARQAGIGVDPVAVDAAVAAQVAPPILDAAPMLSDTTTLRVSAARQQLVLAMIARNTRADMFRSRHILVSDEAVADTILADLAAGKPFADLAQELSTDTASAAQGGELGWVPRGDFVPEYEAVAFSVALNTPTKVQSQFGWHVLVVEERAENRPFESFAQLQASKGVQSYYEQSFVPWYDQLRSAAEASGDLQISPNFDPNSVPLPFPEL